MELCLIRFIIFLTLILNISCKKQETVELSKVQEKLNTDSSQILFILEPNNAVSNISPITIRTMNVKKDDIIRIYTDSLCSIQVAQKTATMSILDIDVIITTNSKQDFYYKKFDANFNSSSCFSTKVSYTLDTTVPALPTSIILNDLISNDSTPIVTFNNIEIGSKVEIYYDFACQFKKEEHIAIFTSPQIEINTPIEGDGIYTIYYKISDEAQNSTGCINSAVNYTYDTTMPTAPTDISLVGSNPVDLNPTITLTFTGLNDSSLIRIYSNSTSACGGFAFRSDTTVLSSTQNVVLTPFISNCNYTFYYQLFDSAGNYLIQTINNTTLSVFETGISYTYDNGAPEEIDVLNNTKKEVIVNGNITTINYPDEGELNTLNLGLTKLEIDATLEIYSNTGCTGTLLLSEINTQTSKALGLKLTTGGVHDISMRQIDPVGNQSSCSDDIHYEFLKIDDFALGNNHSCVVALSDAVGRSFCWGDNSKGQIGNNSNASHFTLPQELSGVFNSSKITAKIDNTCVTDSNTNSVWCAGDNDYNQLTNANTDDISVPVQHSGYIDVGIGKDHLCLIDSTANNYIHCAGKNDKGQLGNGNNTNQTIPTATAVNISATSLAIGFESSCFTDATNTYNCFGLNNDYQLGLTGDSDNTSMAQAMGLGTNISNLVSGSNFSCYIDSVTKLVYCFGSNANKRTGSQTHISSQGITQIDSTKQFDNISIGSDKACGVTVDNELYCWGGSYQGVEKILTQLSFTKVKVGSNHICAIEESGELYCRGSNSYGQLGNNTTNASSIFVKVNFDFNRPILKITPQSLFDINSPKQYNFVTNTYGDYDFVIDIENSGNKPALITTESFSNSEFKYKSGVYPGEITGTECPATKIIAALSTCQLYLTFSPTIASANGVNTQLDIAYSESTNTYVTSEVFTGYTYKVLPDINFEDLSSGFNGNGVFEFNTSGSPINVINQTVITKVITINNTNTNDTASIASISISGNDNEHFSFTGGNFPGTNGTCISDIQPSSGCTISIDYYPLYKASSHDVSIKLLINLNNQISTSELPIRGYAVLDSPIINNYESSILIAGTVAFNLNTSPINFGANQTITKNFELKNEGLNPATISQTTFSGSTTQYEFTGGSFPGTNGTCALNTNLAVGSSCLISVTYKPTEASPAPGHMETLEIEYKNSAFMSEVLTSTIDLNAYAY